MDHIVVKTEVQNDGEILLYYVDENGDNQEGVLTTIENIENDSLQIQENTSTYMLDSYNDLVDVDTSALQDPIEELDSWSDEDINRLLTFYNDNKTSFVSGTTLKKHLWAVACKTMLIGKNQQCCEEKLQEMKSKYSEVRGYVSRGIYVKWPFLDLCHQAFHDDTSNTEEYKITASPQKVEVKTEPIVAVLNQKEKAQSKDGILSIKQLNLKPPDENVEQLLNMYLKYKKNFQKEHWRRDLWDKIAEELGEEDSEYLQKKFLNHKQHYIAMYMRRKQKGASSVNWPYMELFDKIYKDDYYFLKKHFNEEQVIVVPHTVPEHEWNMTQKTVLAKYYFDCYDEFQDDTIPKTFLWTEVGRLIDKKPETCQIQYEILRREHLETYLSGDYNLQRRIPIAIIFDYIILKDVKNVLSKLDSYDYGKDLWKDEQIDELVQFFYDNMELFKDKDCHFVCWAAIAHKIKQNMASCKRQWDDLVVLYKQILEEKKEDSDLQIEWRYIELFDRIFDYGMDTDLLNGYEVEKKSSDQVVVKKVKIKPETLTAKKNENRPAPSKMKDNSIPTTNLSEPRTDPRSTKILEYYLKNKDKLQNAKNPSIWDPLAKQFGMSSSECAHRFKTLEKTYLEYVQREIEKPKIPITWPYYGLCKKIFGHRQTKNKIKQGELDVENDWSVQDIKKLISYFSQHFDEIMNNFNDVSKWAPLASDISKTELFCKDKFIELRKCYRKLRTMKNKNPDMKISWIYFDLFDKVYQSRKVERMEIEEDQILIDGEISPDDDYQCIIVMEDGQVILNNSEVVNDPELIQQLSTMSAENVHPKTSKWTKRNKKRLLIYYINYIRSNKGSEIDPKDIWTNISAEFLNKTAADCRKMFVKMQIAYKRADETVKNNSPFKFLLDKVQKLKPNFIKSKYNKVYKNVPMSSDKVNSALQYYLEHIEEFVNPKYERKYLWSQLADHISEPATKIYNKINYLKQAFNVETGEIDGKQTEFSGLIKEIIAKEVALKIVLDVNTGPDFSNQENTFTDIEIEQLMTWYLENLDKFKNSKFNKSYLWLEASGILNKSPLACSKKMSEIRLMYRNMVRQGDDMSSWRFSELCQKIYGTGKRCLN